MCVGGRPTHSQLEREIAFLKILKHPNVMQLYTVYETSKYLFMVMELLEGGELFDYIASKGKLDVPEVLEYFQQLIFAVEHFHTRHIWFARQGLLTTYKQPQRLEAGEHPHDPRQVNNQSLRLRHVSVQRKR